MSYYKEVENESGVVSMKSDMMADLENDLLGGDDSGSQQRNQSITNLIASSSNNIHRSNGNGNGNGTLSSTTSTTTTSSSFRPLSNRKRTNTDMKSTDEITPTSSQEDYYRPRGSKSNGIEKLEGGVIAKHVPLTKKRSKSDQLTDKERVKLAEDAMKKNKTPTSKPVISLEDLISEKKQRRGEDPLMSIDEMNRQNDEQKRKATGLDLGMAKEDLDKLRQMLKSKPDLMMTENPHHVCLQQLFLCLPKVLQPSNLLDSTYIASSQTETNLINLFKMDRTPFKYFILNGLDYLMNSFTVVPQFIIDILFSYVCFEKEELTVHHSYLILLNLIKKSSTSAVIPFQKFINVFIQNYKINTEQSFQASSLLVDQQQQDDDKQEKQSEQAFPFTNLYYLLNLLKEESTKNQFTIEETKHLIIFIILLTMDPNFLRKNENGEEDNTDIDPLALEEPEKVENKEDNKDLGLSSATFQIVLLLQPLINSLLKSFYDRIPFDTLNDQTIQLFKDIWSSLKERHLYSLCPLASYSLPTVNQIGEMDLQRKFALFSIGKLLNIESIDEIISKQTSIVEELVKIIKPFISQIKTETINVLMVLNLVTLVDICSNDRNELNEQHKKDKKNTFTSLIIRWVSKTKESKDSIDFNITRIKDGLVLIQSKLAALIKEQSTISTYFTELTPSTPQRPITSYFTKIEKKEENQDIDNNNHNNNTTTTTTNLDLDNTNNDNNSSQVLDTSSSGDQIVNEKKLDDLNGTNGKESHPFVQPTPVEEPQQMSIANDTTK